MSASVSSETFSSVMTAALNRKQVTLSELRDRLMRKGHSISLTALSYWRSGMRLPERRSSLEAIPEIESLLELAPGTLSRFVAGYAARRIGRVESFDSLLDYQVVGSAAGSEFLGESDVSRVATHVTLSVGPQRSIVWTRMRRVVVANRDGVEGLTVFMGTDEQAGANAYRFRAVAGCTIHEDRHPARNVRSVQLRFPRPLMMGESAITEVEVTQSEEAVIDLVDDYEVVAEQRLEEVLLWVNFDPLAVPARCWVYFAEAGLRREWPVDLDGTSSMHYRQRDFGPGALGIRWEW